MKKSITFLLQNCFNFLKQFFITGVMQNQGKMEAPENDQC